MNSKRSSWRGCPIRESSDRCLLPAPRSVSPVSAPFIVSECLGLHRKPLFLWPKNAKLHPLDFFQHFFWIQKKSKRKKTKINSTEKIFFLAFSLRKAKRTHIVSFLWTKQNSKKGFWSLSFIIEWKGGNKGIRTLGPCLAKAVLYQLSYIPFFAEHRRFFSFFFK